MVKSAAFIPAAAESTAELLEEAFASALGSKGDGEIVRGEEC